MQRKAILVLLLLCSLGAWAQQKEKTRKKRKFVFGVGATVNGTTTVIPIDHTTHTPPRPKAGAGAEYKQMGASMPPVRVVYPKKAVYTDETLKNDANLIIMMFNPTCEHCEDMALALEQNIDLFKKSNLLLMAAPAMGPYLEFFENGTKVQKYPKIKMGLDSSGFIDRTFTYEMLPQINVYDADRKLIKTFNGITEIDSLKPYIQ